MKVKEVLEKCDFEIINLGDESLEISGVFCCDLLSIVMGKAFRGCAWVTVMGNINSIAVATLAEISCIVLCEATSLDEKMLFKACQQNVTILKSKSPVFETALEIHKVCSNA